MVRLSTAFSFFHHLTHLIEAETYPIGQLKLRDYITIKGAFECLHVAVIAKEFLNVTIEANGFYIVR